MELCAANKIRPTKALVASLCQAAPAPQAHLALLPGRALLRGWEAGRPCQWLPMAPNSHQWPQWPLQLPTAPNGPNGHQQFPMAANGPNSYQQLPVTPTATNSSQRPQPPSAAPTATNSSQRPQWPPTAPNGHQQPGGGTGSHGAGRAGHSASGPGPQPWAAAAWCLLPAGPVRCGAVEASTAARTVQNPRPQLPGCAQLWGPEGGGPKPHTPARWGRAALKGLGVARGGPGNGVTGGTTGGAGPRKAHALLSFTFTKISLCYTVCIVFIANYTNLMKNTV